MASAASGKRLLPTTVRRSRLLRNQLADIAAAGAEQAAQCNLPRSALDRIGREHVGAECCDDYCNGGCEGEQSGEPWNRLRSWRRTRPWRGPISSTELGKYLGQRARTACRASAMESTGADRQRRPVPEVVGDGPRTSRSE